jgi:hypothetical protein
MFVDTTVREVKQNRLTSTVVVDYVNPNGRIYVGDNGTAVVSFDEHDSWNMHIKLEQALLLVEWANNLVKALELHETDPPEPVI